MFIFSSFCDQRRENEPKEKKKRIVFYARRAFGVNKPELLGKTGKAGSFPLAIVAYATRSRVMTYRIRAWLGSIIVFVYI